MRPWIDRDGRLFGWINLIDAIVLCVALALSPVLWYAYRIAIAQTADPSTRPPPREERAPLGWSAGVEEVTLDFVVRFNTLTKDQVDLIQAGDEDTSEPGHFVAKVLSVDTVEPELADMDLGSGVRVILGTISTYSVVATMRLKCTVGPPYLWFKRNALRADRPSLLLVTPKYTLSGIIVRSVGMVSRDAGP